MKNPKYIVKDLVQELEDMGIHTAYKETRRGVPVAVVLSKRRAGRIDVCYFGTTRVYRAFHRPTQRKKTFENKTELIEVIKNNFIAW